MSLNVGARLAINVACVGTASVLLGRQRVREAARLARRDGMRWWFRDGFPVLLFIFTAANAASIIGHYDAPIDAAMLADSIVKAALIMPWARFVTVDVPLATAWWTTTWHRTAFAATIAVNGVLYIVDGHYVTAVLEFFFALYWWRWWGWWGRDDWRDEPVPEPTPDPSERAPA